MFSIVCILISTLVFALVHSVLATQRVKNLGSAHGLRSQHYRFAYVIIATMMTIAWLYFIKQLPDQPLYSLDDPALCYTIQAGAIALFWLSLKPIDIRAFLGLSPFSNGREEFIDQGIYRHLRHPMYSSVIIMMFAMPIQSRNSLTLYSLVTLYFIIGSRLEERRMLALHPEYVAYRLRVPAFIPRLIPRERGGG